MYCRMKIVASRHMQARGHGIADLRLDRIERVLEFDVEREGLAYLLTVPQVVNTCFVYFYFYAVC